MYLIYKGFIRLNECQMALLWRFFVLKLLLLIINNRARAPPDELGNKISIRSGGFFMNLSYGLFDYDYLPIIRKYVIFHKGLDEKVAYEIKDPKEFYNYVMCLAEDPSLPYTIRFEYFIKCKELKGKNVARVSKEYFIDFFKTQNYRIWHDDYILRRYYDQFVDVDQIIVQNPTPNETIMTLDPLEILVKNELNSEIKKVCKSKLSTDEIRRIYKYLYENKNFTEISEEENLTRQAVSISVNKALKKLKENLSKNF